MTETTAAPGSILVLGIGELGEAVLRALVPRAAREGLAVDVLVRPGSERSARLVTAHGAGSVEGDVAQESEAELAARFAAYDTVVSCIGFAGGPGTQLKLARAALASGVRRFVPWQFGIDFDALGRGGPQPLFDEQLDVRDLLRAQDRVQWVAVSVGIFTSFLFEPDFGVVDLDAGIVRALGGWDNAVTATTPEDIGRLTTEILFAEPAPAGGAVHVAGDTVTYAELADAVERVLRRPVTREVLGRTELDAELSEDPEDTMRRYRAVFALGRGMSWPVAETFNARHGIAVTDVETWLRERVVRPGPLGRTPYAGVGRHEGVVMTGEDRDEGVKAFVIHIEAKPGHEDEVVAMLANIRAAVEEEPGTGPWYAMRYGPTSFMIVEAFPSIAGRDAHVAGDGGRIFRDLERMNAILAEPAHVAKTDVLMTKRVFTHGDV